MPNGVQVTPTADGPYMVAGEFARDWDRVVLRRHAGDDSLVAFYLKDGRIEAACALNRSQDANVIKRLIGGTGVSDADLADDAKSLKSLIPASEYV